MIKIFARYSKSYTLYIILAPIFKIFEAVFGLIVPLVIKDIIDKGIDGEMGINYIINEGLILLALAIVGFLMTMVCQILSVKVSAEYAYAIRNDLYKKINTFSYKELDEFTASSLQTRLSSDIIQTQNAFAMMLRLAIRAPFIVVGSVIMSIIISPSLSWIFLVSGVLLGLIIFIIGFIAIPYNTKIQKNLDLETNIVDDNLTGARIVRAFNKEKYETNRFFKITGNIQQISTRLAKISSLSNPLNTIVVNFALMAILYLGAINISTDTLTQGAIVSLVNYMNQIAAAIVVVANLIVIFSKGSSSAKRLWQVIDAKSSLIVGNLNFNKDDRVKIEFDNVSFKYNKDSSYSLENFSYHFEEGKTYGIIGGTGSGKTTLINLICHFYDPSVGQILLNNKRIEEYKESSILENIGLVQQNPVLFSGSIESNLKFGKKDATKEEMEKAISLAQGENILESKGSLDALINQGGKNLSGGQRQRLAIARAFVKNPKILILDDSSSALDFKTDFNLRKAIKDNFKKQLVIFVSQRVNSIKDADEILVLEKGKLIASGKHNELLESSKVYKDFYLSQEQTKWRSLSLF